MALQVGYSNDSYEPKPMELYNLWSPPYENFSWHQFPFEEGYSREMFLQGPGDSYIDTGFKPNYDTKMILEFEATSNEGQVFAGCRTEQKKEAFTINCSGTNIVAAFGNQGNQTLSSSATSQGRCVVRIDRSGLYLNGDRKGDPDESQWTQSRSIFLFGVNQEDNNKLLSNAKIYSCAIYQLNQLVRFFVPFQNSGEYFMFDAVENKEYGFIKNTQEVTNNA